jgi:hypothetical protein
MQTPALQFKKFKTCVFCKKSSPEVKISREHVLRKKIKNILPEIDGMFLHQFNFDTQTGDLSHKSKNIPQSPYELQVNDVCKTCNEGWMERLEVEAEEFLFPLISGEIIELPKNATDILALWGAKTAAVRGLVDSKTIAVPSEHFSWIKENLTPPPFTFMWMGRAEFKPESLTRQLTFKLQYSGKLVYLHLTTLVIGHVVFFILGCGDQVGVETCLPTISYLNAQSIFRIWPTANAAHFKDFPELRSATVKELSSGKFRLSRAARPDFQQSRKD